jgi:hypothetical protein
MPASHDSTRFSTAREIALAFGGSGAASASGWHDFRCPAHDDKTASCGVKDDRDRTSEHDREARFERVTPTLAIPERGAQ